ncbi:hypothetical protein WA026_001351 [Henosepilachna vigintioctopunctata]|uniref:Ribosomal protein L32 n=1 Tax=Henosepilachna vigintioctopunctata TaxID=420089 RepID=A0AAW1UUB9_9CUCU
MRTPHRTKWRKTTVRETSLMKIVVPESRSGSRFMPVSPSAPYALTVPPIFISIKPLGSVNAGLRGEALRSKLQNNVLRSFLLDEWSSGAPIRRSLKVHLYSSSDSRKCMARPKRGRERRQKYVEFGGVFSFEI